jgi:hypothetical protein
MQTPEGPSPEPSGLVPGPDPAPPSPLDPPGAPAGAKPAAKKAPILRISASQAQALGSVAAGASTVFLLGTAATLLVSLFPVQLVNSQWQLSQMANLVANGSWLLLGLVLLHLAVLLQPNQARLTQRLATLRWLAAGAAVLYLLLAPLQLVATWNGIDAVENTRGRVMGGTMARVKALRVAIQKASDLPDLRRRAAAIPGAPPIPEEAANLPFETLRRTLLGQLGRDQREAPAGPGHDAHRPAGDLAPDPAEHLHQPAAGDRLRQRRPGLAGQALPAGQPAGAAAALPIAQDPAAEAHRPACLATGLATGHPPQVRFLWPQTARLEGQAESQQQPQP